ncbi:MAG: class II aldolase/adducin family protein [Deltaproteobacteria bacterium]|nr:class II aldolase/adducin family protein [Deltaproteobacteria bacterium]
MPSEHDLRQDLLRFGHLCYERHLLVAMDGNLSVRLPSGDLLCTRSGCHKGFLQDSDLIVVDAKGHRKRGEGQPTSEMAMHLACYAERPEIRAVIHAHPPLCVAFTLAGVSMSRAVLPEVVLTLGSIPTAPYETTGSEALAETIRRYVKQYDAILMDTHGAVCVGRTLLEAFCRLETMEHTAQILKAAQDLGSVRSLPEDEVRTLKRLGEARAGRPSPPPEAPLPTSAPPARPAPPPLADPLVDLDHIGISHGLRMVRVSQGPLRDAQANPDTPRTDLEALVAEEVFKALKQG